MRSLVCLSIAIALAVQPLFGQGPDERQREYLNFIKAQAAKLREADKPPATREECEDLLVDFALEGALRELGRELEQPRPWLSVPLRMIRYLIQSPVAAGA